MPHPDGILSDATAIGELCARAEVLRQAGRLEDALALLGDTDGRPVDPGTVAPPDRLRLVLLRARILTDRIFHANRGYGEARAALEDAQSLAEQLGDEGSAAAALDLLGLAEYFGMLQAGGKDYEAPLGRFRAALARREALGDMQGIAESLFHVGVVHERLEQYDQALENYRRAYALAKEHGHQLELSYAARHLGGGAHAMGDLDAALALFEESLALRQELGYTLLLPLAHIALGDVLLARKDVDGAAGQYEWAHTLAQGMQSPLATVFSLLALSEITQAHGDADAARGYAERALTLAETADVPLGIRAASATLDLLA